MTTVIIGRAKDGSFVSVVCPTDGQNHSYTESGITAYLTDGKFHRDGGPALTNSTSSFWYQTGILTRSDGPAMTNEQADYWYLNGKLHRNGDAAILWKNGDKDWYQNGINYNPTGPSTLSHDGTAIYNDSTGKFLYMTK